MPQKVRALQEFPLGQGETVDENGKKGDPTSRRLVAVGEELTLYVDQARKLRDRGKVEFVEGDTSTGDEQE